ncbi:DUF4280 domain-containing protein [Pedobacter jejuensis]|uniref:DUF4280 domain-containing protein n=1 Tax=Pedobacter jejuensis TaxID=1268550 RepID=A0A3N0C1B5_9SPHI|nr:DUF4280 domain-containing protein [Pedobacter jejuensis]RNL55854.1 DUF4280 domain-containing protein [Pedobacter jejuensis]
MSYSYVHEGANVICTNMTNGKPLQIGISRVSTVILAGKKAPLLNINDRKISDTFSCKVASKFWGGLQILTAVIAVAGLAVATVATGGLALVAAGVMLAAAATSIGAGVTGLYKRAHDCDATLEGQWMLPHGAVKLDKEKALLSQSLMNCPKGGVVSIIIDPVIAMAAAKEITSNNNAEINAHLASQAVIGVITAATAFTPIGLLVAAPIAVYGYVDGENTKEEAAKKNLPIWRWSDVGDAAKTEGMVNQPLGVSGAMVESGVNLTIENKAITKEIAEHNLQAALLRAEGNVAGAEAAELTAMRLSRMYPSTRTAFIGPEFWKGLAKGVAGAIANYLIDRGSDSYELAKAKNSFIESDNSNNQDINNNIGVVSNNPK